MLQSDGQEGGQEERHNREAERGLLGEELEGQDMEDFPPPRSLSRLRMNSHRVIYSIMYYSYCYPVGFIPPWRNN